MFDVRKAFSFLSGIKSAVSVAKAFVEMADRANDDLDDDGKAEYENIMEDGQVFVDHAVACGKELYQDGLRIFKRAERLVLHIAKGGK